VECTELDDSDKCWSARMAQAARSGRPAAGGPCPIQYHRGGGREQRGADGDQGDLPARHAINRDGMDGDVYRLVYVRGRQRRVLVPAWRLRR
jgi:hypothetical protein